VSHPGFTLDAGALFALQRRKQRAWRFIELAHRDDLELHAPADVLAEFWRGGNLIRPVATLIEHGVEWIDVTPSLAKRAGTALIDAGPVPSAIDAVVATVAAAFGDVILTSDPDDFARLARHYRGLRALSV
jgi:predicted nucleic acid-binding protein